MSEETERSYRRRLPHYRSANSIYFVTWRLARHVPELTPGERRLVAIALRHSDGKSYQLHAYVVMNDHVHALVEPAAPRELEQIVHSWKSYTANRIQRASRREGKIWQAEYFDRLIRGEEEFEEKRKYILANPAKRWPDVVNYEWVWYSAEP